jgi:hypothetical protein
MLVLMILALFTALAASMAGYAFFLLENLQAHRATLDNYYVSVTAESLRMRMARTGGLGTVTVADLISLDEGFKVKGVDTDRLYLAAATNISDGIWRFDRALIYALSDLGDRNWDPTTVASNTCSTTAGFNTAPSWCGPSSDVTYHLIETRETYLSLMTDEAMRMQFTLQKLARGYSVVEPDTFPRGAITAGSSAEICTTGGGTCVNTSCTSPVVLQQTPLDCADQFSRWGAPVVLNLVTGKHVGLATTATTVRRTAGTSRRVARELRVP